MPSILIVSGSPSATSRSEALGRLTGATLAERGYAVDYLSLRTLPPAALMLAQFGNADLRASQDRLADADAVVFTTPIYKASCSGLLKTWLDLLPQYGLAGKTVLPLATGGSLAHALAIDYGIRPILSSMNPAQLVRGVLVTDDQLQRHDDGRISLGEVSRSLYDAVVEDFLSVLPRPDRARLVA